MKILVLVNWKVKKCNEVPKDLQSPDYYTKKEKYWFFKYFPKETQVDVIDMSSFKFWENIERNKLHFHIVQTIKAIAKIRKYDVVISDGMPSGIGLALFRRFFKTKAKHIVFDIGLFNSGAESGKILKLNQFASKSIDGIICHSSEHLKYYKKFYPWLVEKSKFIPFGTDIQYFGRDKIKNVKEENYIIAIGRGVRDYKTLINVFKEIKGDIKLKIVGETNLETNDERIQLIESMPKRKLNIAIQKAKLCVLPLENKKFSFGQMTLLQQMYYEKAVITVKIPSMKDYVKDGKTGIFYKQRNKKDLKEKIEKLLEDKDLREEIGRNAKKSIEEKFNEKNLGEESYRFIKKIMEAHNKNV